MRTTPQILELTHLDRRAQSRVDLELNVGGVTKRGYKDCIWFEFIDRAWRFDDQPVFAPPALCGIVIDHSQNLKSHGVGDTVACFHDFTSSVEDHTLHSSSFQFEQFGPN